MTSCRPIETDCCDRTQLPALAGSENECYLREPFYEPKLIVPHKYHVKRIRCSDYYPKPVPKYVKDRELARQFCRDLHCSVYDTGPCDCVPDKFRDYIYNGSTHWGHKWSGTEEQNRRRLCRAKCTTAPKIPVPCIKVGEKPDKVRYRIPMFEKCPQIDQQCGTTWEHDQLRIPHEKYEKLHRYPIRGGPPPLIGYLTREAPKRTTMHLVVNNDLRKEYDKFPLNYYGYKPHDAVFVNKAKRHFEPEEPLNTTYQIAYKWHDYDRYRNRVPACLLGKRDHVDKLPSYPDQFIGIRRHPIPRC